MKNKKIMSILLESIDNDGVFNVKARKTKTYEDRYDALYAFSKWDLKASFLFSNVIYKGSHKKRRVRKNMNKIIVDKNDNLLFIDLYQVLQIPKEKRNIDTLRSFVVFFQVFKSFLEKDCEALIQVVTHPEKSRFPAELVFKDNSPASKEERDAMINQFLKVLNENMVVVNWLDTISKDLSRYVGIWSWDTIQADCVLSIKDKWTLYDKHYPEI